MVKPIYKPKYQIHFGLIHTGDVRLHCLVFCWDLQVVWFLGGLLFGISTVLVANTSFVVVIKAFEFYLFYSYLFLSNS